MIAEAVAVVTILLAPAGLVLGWLAVMAVIVAALSGAAAGVTLVSPPSRMDADPSGASSH